jgi:alpha-mannosidase
VQAEVYKRGYELNVPLRSAEVVPSNGYGNLPAVKSLLQLNHSNVMVETVKLAEEGEDLIFRLYETAGTHALLTLPIEMNLSEAWLADLMEEKLEQLQFNGGSVELDFTPFEIKTLRLSHK